MQHQVKSKKQGDLQQLIQDGRTRKKYLQPIKKRYVYYYFKNLKGPGTRFKVEHMSYITNPTVKENQSRIYLTNEIKIKLNCPDLGRGGGLYLPKNFNVKPPNFHYLNYDLIH